MQFFWTKLFLYLIKFQKCFRFHEVNSQKLSCRHWDQIWITKANLKVFEYLERDQRYQKITSVEKHF